MGARQATLQPSAPAAPAQDFARAGEAPAAAIGPILAEPRLPAFTAGVSASDIAGAPKQQPPPPNPAPAAPTDDAAEARKIARQLCAALDRAVSLGLLEHADRVALSAAPLARLYAPLAERLARLRLRQQRPETALAIIDGCTWQCASLRQLRAVCLLLTGRKIEAHLDLHEWCRRAIAPLDARILLAMLEFEAGDARAAIHALQRNLKHLEDPRTIQLLLLLAVQSDRREQAEAWARRLSHASQSAPPNAGCGLLLRSLDLHRFTDPAAPDARHVQMLAMELVTFEQAIPALIEAQERRPEQRSASALAGAIERALPELSDRAAAFEALARLALLAGDRGRARTWVERGRAMHPLSATLTMLAERIEASLPTAVEAPRQRRGRAA